MHARNGSEAGERAEDTTRAVGAVRRIVRSLRLAAQQTHVEAGISTAQLYVLSCLADGAASSLTELGERTLTDRTSVAEVVDRLVFRGLAERDHSGADRRRTGVRITDEGRAVLRDAPLPPTARLFAGLQALDDAELRTLAAGLERLAERMGLAAEPAPMLFEDEVPPRRARDGSALHG
ncbi:MAG TPA: MarR family transcriptional regulator [Longimicrobiaceae bacterium]